MLALVGWGLLIKSLLRFCVPKQELRMMARVSVERCSVYQLRPSALVPTRRREVPKNLWDTHPLCAASSGILRTGEYDAWSVFAYRAFFARTCKARRETAPRTASINRVVAMRWRADASVPRSAAIDFRRLSSLNRRVMGSIPTRLTTSGAARRGLQEWSAFTLKRTPCCRESAVVRATGSSVPLSAACSA